MRASLLLAQHAHTAIQEGGRERATERDGEEGGRGNKYIEY
jgi:hypothetical protein